MPWFKRDNNSKKQVVDEQPIKVLSISSRELSQEKLSELVFSRSSISLVVAFVSPHLDFENTLRQIKSALPEADKVIGVMTAGELSSCQGGLYHQAGDHWDHIVVQSYSSDVFAEVSVSTVPLFCEDIRAGNVTLSRKQRVEKFSAEFKRISPPFNVNYQDTLP